jgi:hypothetical protein
MMRRNPADAPAVGGTAGVDSLWLVQAVVRGIMSCLPLAQAGNARSAPSDRVFRRGVELNPYDLALQEPEELSRARGRYPFGLGCNASSSHGRATGREDRQPDPWHASSQQAIAPLA